MIGERPEQWDTCSATMQFCNDPYMTCKEECECYANTRRSSGIGFTLCVEQCSGSSSRRCSIILGEARRLKGRNLSGLEILSELLEYAQNQFNYTSSKELSDDISCAIIGTRGPRTVIAATPLNIFGIFGPSADPTDHEEDLGVGGWHPDYEDGTANQPYHFWAYVNTVAQSGSTSLAIGADQFHECFDLRADQNGQRTIEDSQLAVAGMILGLQLYSGEVTPGQVSDWVNTWLGNQSFEGLLESLSPEEASLWHSVLSQRFCPFIE